jgi:hypothetical protein
VTFWVQHWGQSKSREATVEPLATPYKVFTGFCVSFLFGREVSVLGTKSGNLLMLVKWTQGLAHAREVFLPPSFPKASAVTMELAVVWVPSWVFLVFFEPGPVGTSCSHWLCDTQLVLYFWNQFLIWNSLCLKYLYCFLFSWVDIDWYEVRIGKGISCFQTEYMRAKKCISSVWCQYKWRSMH